MKKSLVFFAILVGSLLIYAHIDGTERTKDIQNIEKTNQMLVNEKGLKNSEGIDSTHLDYRLPTTME